MARNTSNTAGGAMGISSKDTNNNDEISAGNEHPEITETTHKHIFFYCPYCFNTEFHTSTRYKLKGCQP